MLIRPHRPDDLPTLRAIAAAAFAPVVAGLRDRVGPGLAPAAFGAAEAMQAGRLDALATQGELLVAEIDGALVGFAGLVVQGSLGELELNAVHPDHQRRGVGRALTSAALDRLRTLGAEVASVATGTDAGHAPALAAYRAAGFGAEIAAVRLYRAL